MHLLKIISNYYVIHKTKINLSDVPQIGDLVFLSGNRYKVTGVRRTYDMDARPSEISIELSVSEEI